MIRIKAQLKSSFLYNSLRKIKIEYEYFRWQFFDKNTCTPHKLKQKTIIEYQNKFNCSTFIETGTFLGDMVDALHNKFELCFSIELDKELFNRAVNRFKNKTKIKIFNGDSGKVLSEILPEIKTPSVFWLDAHYSGGITAKGEEDTPILKELKIIFNHPVKNHLVLIDDARCFNGENSYPTLNKLSEIVAVNYPGSTLSVKDDIIRIIPGN